MGEKKLVIFTYGYPFGKGEPFLESELFHLSQHFGTVHIFPLFSKKTAIPREIPHNVTFSQPFARFDLKKDKLSFLFHGLLNRAPWWFSVKELFQSKAYGSFKKLNRWLAATLIGRILLSPGNWGRIMSQLGGNSLIYFYWGDKSSVIVPFLKRVVSSPVVVRFHGSDLYEELNQGYIPFRRSLIENLDHALFVSETGMNYLKGRYPDIKFRASLFRLGVSPGKMNRGSSDSLLRLVSCSQIIPLKRVHLICEALRLIPFRVEWTHFGGGPLWEEIKELAATLSENIRVDLKGDVKNEVIRNHYSEHPVDLFIHTSMSEGLPVSIMEAFSSGIPAIATDAGGTREIVDATTGFLLPVELTPEDIAGKLTLFYNSGGEMKKKLREAAYERWQSRFDAEKNHISLSRFLSSLI